jgi:small subunit ribosomal protein S20
MPNSSSAKKRLRQNAVRRESNLATKRSLRTQIRKVQEAIKAGNAEAATTEFRLAVKKLDRAGSQNVIHRNAVARIKSRLSARVKAIKVG